jgi:hypothetical protein
VDISGLGKRRLETVAGEDSLQALTLAMEFVIRVLPIDANRAGGHLQWLGERENLVFANTLHSGLLARGLHNCMAGLAEAIDVLEKPVNKPLATTIARRLRALIASGGQTADPRRVPPSELAKVRVGAITAAP